MGNPVDAEFLSLPHTLHLFCHTRNLALHRQIFWTCNVHIKRTFNFYALFGLQITLNEFNGNNTYTRMDTNLYYQKQEQNHVLKCLVRGVKYYGVSSSRTGAVIGLYVRIGVKSIYNASYQFLARPTLIGGASEIKVYTFFIVIFKKLRQQSQVNVGSANVFFMGRYVRLGRQSEVRQLWQNLSAPALYMLLLLGRGGYIEGIYIYIGFMSLLTMSVY